MYDKADPTALRVASRYAALMTEQKMLDILAKIRKGTGYSNLSLSQVTQIFNFLPGWSIEPFIGLVQMHGYGGADADKRALLAERDEGAARGQYEHMKKHEVASLPSHPAELQDYYMDIEPFRDWFAGEGGPHYWGTNYRHWRGAKGMKVTSPSGAQFEVLPSRFDKVWEPAKYFYTDKIWPWLVKHTSFKADVNQALGTEPHMPAQTRTRESTGTCPACWRNIKIKEGTGQHPTLVLHGYRRPGTGATHGQCPCIYMPPYEVSVVGAQHMLKLCEQGLKDREDYLSRLQRGEIKQLPGSFGQRMMTPETEGVHWPYIVKQEVESAEREVRYSKARVKFYLHAVSAWKLRPLPKEGQPEKYIAMELGLELDKLPEGT